MEMLTTSILGVWVNSRLLSSVTSLAEPKPPSSLLSHDWLERPPCWDPHSCFEPAWWSQLALWFLPAWPSDFILQPDSKEPFWEKTPCLGESARPQQAPPISLSCCLDPDFSRAWYSLPANFLFSFYVTIAPRSLSHVPGPPCANRTKRQSLPSCSFFFLSFLSFLCCGTMTPWPMLHSTSG